MTSDIRRNFESNEFRALWIAFYAGLRVESLLSEIQDAPIKLVGKDPELYATYDRIRAEAEFRSLLVPPFVLFTAGLAVSSYWWLMLLIAPVILRQQARQLTRDANNALAEAIRVGRVDSATLAEQPSPDELVAGQFGIRRRSRVLQRTLRTVNTETRSAQAVLLPEGLPLATLEAEVPASGELAG